MTAKEIAKNKNIGMVYRQLSDGTVDKNQLYEFNPKELQEYADALCKEQRSACLEAYEDDWKSESILTAPQPEAL